MSGGIKASWYRNGGCVACFYSQYASNGSGDIECHRSPPPWTIVQRTNWCGEHRIELPPPPGRWERFKSLFRRKK